jgi:hypothetical protein
MPRTRSIERGSSRLVAPTVRNAASNSTRCGARSGSRILDFASGGVHGAGGHTASSRRITSGCCGSRTASAPSAGGNLVGSCVSTTATRRKECADCFATNAIPRSGCSATTRIGCGRRGRMWIARAGVPEREAVGEGTSPSPGLGLENEPCGASMYRCAFGPKPDVFGLVEQLRSRPNSALAAPPLSHRPSP